MPIEEIITKTITCKNCGSDAIIKFGTYKGVQRYYCKACQRKFKADADLFHMKVPDGKERKKLQDSSSKPRWEFSSV